MSKFKSGDWVEVRSKDEILATLDDKGRFEGLPFMPQMLRYCGRRFKVFQRAHKTCDTIVYNWDSPGRKLPGGIHLNLRCDGKAYGGCQAACLIFWKEAWLKPAEGEAEPTFASGGGCTEAGVLSATRADDPSRGEKPRYSCQATELLNFTSPLPWWDARQYLEDYISGNATLGKIARGFIFVGYFYGTLAFSRKLGAPARWLYDRFQALWGGLPYPRHRGSLPSSQLAPKATLDLQAGDFVRVKSYEDILATLDTDNKNRGMSFDGEMMPYCGTVLRVRGRVERFIDEKTGYLKRMKTPAVILEGAICKGRYSNHRMFCPRGIYSWWREIWLERVPADARDAIADAPVAPCSRVPARSDRPGPVSPEWRQPQRPQAQERNLPR